MDTWAPAAEDLEAYRLTESAPHDDVDILRHATHDTVTLAAADQDLIVGMAVVKPGVFNGVFEVTRDDLDAWVARFEELRGTFRPPMRLDHGWSVTEVIGRFEALRVENRTDDSAGGTVVPMLVGDWRIVGTPDERKAIREWIKGDRLNERSSEFRPYRTNTGAEYPSIFAGCAFVDIPAVEGLGAITLRRQTATLAAGAPDAPEETGPMADEQTPEVDETPTTQDQPEQEATSEADGIVIAQPEPEVEPEAELEPEPEEPQELAARLRSQGIALDARTLAAIDSVVNQLAADRAQADERIARFRAAGVLVPAIADTATALLRHPDPEVRDGIAAVLDIARPPVALRQVEGVTTSPEPGAGDGAISPSELRELDTIAFAKAWQELSPTQRKAQEYRDAYDAVVQG